MMRLYNYVIPITAVLLALVFAVFDLNDAVRFERAGLQQGEWWRLISGHFAHLGWVHWALNVIGLLLIWSIFRLQKTIAQAYGELLFLAGAISVALYYLSPEISWYVGLSGILHGLFALGCVTEIKQRTAFGTIGLAVLLIKVGLEQFTDFHNAMVTSEGPVVVAAHLYGAVAGIILASAKFVSVHLMKKRLAIK